MTASLWDAVDDRMAWLAPPDARPLPIQRRRRRGFDPLVPASRASVDLMRDRDGTLRWVYRTAGSSTAGRRTYRSTPATQGELVRRYPFHDLPPNQVTQALVALDARLNPRQGLHQWRAAGLEPVAQPRVEGETLLLVHGTFSESRMFADELAATAHGQALQALWRARYGDRIFGFDHPTLSVGAWWNAVALMGEVAGMAGPIDVVCHSRGGLVVAWLLRLADVPVRRVVFVGSPLSGTSLASPARLRAALDMLANTAEALAFTGDAAGSALPLAAGAAGIARIFGKVLRLGSSLPLADAGVSLVPGLASQQRTGNNLERDLLLARDWKSHPLLLAVGGHFEPDESLEGWRFWRRFTHIGGQLAHAAADVVFEGRNDLVVDVQAMGELGDRGPIAFTDLGASATTHHTSYFRDPRVTTLLAG